MIDVLAPLLPTPLAGRVLGAPCVDLGLWPQQRAALNGRLKRHRRRAAGILTAAEWRRILAQYGHRCLCCGSTGPLTIDHIVPVSKGGPNTAANVQPLCGPCNSSKATKTIDYRPAAAAV